MVFLPALFITIFAATTAATITAPTHTTTTTTSSFPSTLNITTITAHNNQSALECWALDPGYTTSAQAGVSGTAMLSLGPITSNATSILIPGAYDGGRHNAPTIQYVPPTPHPITSDMNKLNHNPRPLQKKRWVIFLSGVAHITLPNSTDEAWVVGGRNGAILALDTEELLPLRGVVGSMG
ncbi:hypothetical protein ASPCADRAFT_403988 [Aspergillus carbonarius ITEM 5010]|uniref:Uncharacterized protein n=1 Tax=Aspergillus carbonarius (strain ITEM 5010) TaxID=602072 RepID=A0A1R3RUM3_ASPC5|nr:hypothetical protein ASPCADRAFT_403988 [Aspergillus carbonarius ITEM 5010]